MEETILKVIELVVPLFLSVIVQALKKVFNKGGFVALAMVFVLGGIGALVGVGPVPNDNYIDVTVNVGYITGLATFIYSLLKRIGAGSDGQTSSSQEQK